MMKVYGKEIPISLFSEYYEVFTAEGPRFCGPIWVAAVLYENMGTFSCLSSTGIRPRFAKRKLKENLRKKFSKSEVESMEFHPANRCEVKPPFYTLT